MVRISYLKKFILLQLALFAFCRPGWMQHDFATPFEKSKGTQTSTYQEGIAYFYQLSKAFPEIDMKPFGKTDSGYPLHLVTLSLDRDFSPTSLHRKGKIILLINNAIHPGEPDGVDACMMLLRDLVQKKNTHHTTLEKVVIGIIPFYSIGGVLNRNAFSRVNQNGPVEYGFRGNARNYDLNRDFIKSDTKNARSFAKIFHYLDPDVFVDTHVSNGADYQYTITMLTTQKDKLGGPMGDYLHNQLMPALYGKMERAKESMIPYVNGFSESGFTQFLDTPRYSSGYAALFHTFGFICENHMLKPFKNRVQATNTLLEQLLDTINQESDKIKQLRAQAKESAKSQKTFPITWKLDRSQHDEINFKGYTSKKIISKVTGKERLYYDRTQPYVKKIPFYNHYIPDVTIQKPQYYLIPRAWHNITELLQLNQVKLTPLKKDTILDVEVYYIEDFGKTSQPYEGHYIHNTVKLRKETQQLAFRKGDYLVPTDQWNNRYIVETLEPEAHDSFFRWNFFDTILQQKEHYSAYVFEEIAERLLIENQTLREQFEQKKQKDNSFAESSKQQLDFIYRNSPYYEKEHLRYPVFRVMK